MEGVVQPPMEAYRHVQVARHLLDTGQGRFEDMTFEDGRLVDFGVPRPVIEGILEEGRAFMTTGCPGCNRPFANETPSQAAEGLLRNYPFVPTEEDTTLIRQQL
jgi:biotin synthase